MTSTIQILIGFVFLVGAFILSQIIVNRRLRTTGTRIILELIQQEALDRSRAVALAYAQPGLLPKGLRDFRPKALNDLVQGDIIGKTATGKFFLKKQPDELDLGDTRLLTRQKRR